MAADVFFHVAHQYGQAETMASTSEGPAQHELGQMLALMGMNRPVARSDMMIVDGGVFWA